jgi:PAS domain S-box-containing protein
MLGALHFPRNVFSAGDSDRRRAAYHAESLASSYRGAAGLCIIPIVLIGASAIISYVVDPPGPSVILRIRLFGILVFGGVLLLLRTPLGQRRPRELGLLAMLLIGLILSALAPHTGGPASHEYDRMNLVILGGGVLMAWSPAWSALASVVVMCTYVVGVYVVGVLALAEWPGWSTFFGDLGFLTTSSLIAIGLTATRDRLRWMEFCNRSSLSDAQRETREREQRYRSLVETAGSVIIVLSSDQRILEFNREAECVSGWQRQEVLGSNYSEVFLPVGVRETVAAEFKRVFEGRSVHGVEHPIRIRDGTERLLLWNVTRLGTAEDAAVCVLAVGQDITERKRAEQALRESEVRLRTIIGNAPIVLCAVDRTGMFTLLEGKGLEELGLEPGAVGESIFEVYRNRPTELKYFCRALEGEPVSWVGRSGNMAFEGRLTPVSGRTGHVTGAIGVLIDITARKQAEDGRIALERKLLETQKLESLGVLAGGIAHDFNNLLMGIMGNASLAVSDLPATAPAGEHVRQIEVAAQRAADLTEELLAYAGRGHFTVQPVDVNEILEEMGQLSRASVDKHTTLKHVLARDVPAVVADVTQLRQVVMNLVINAADAIGTKGGEITLSTGVVCTDRAILGETYLGGDLPPGEYVYVEVADTGCGIDAATIPRIFDPFFTTKSTGRGLGLAAVLGIVRAHQGALKIASTPLGGSRFRILLPAASRAATRPAEPDIQGSERHVAKTVLLIDDDDEVRLVTAHMLERLGCHVLQACDGPEGLASFRNHANVIDTVLVDVTLPKMNGNQVFDEIRHMKPDTRVVLMSGYSEAETGCGGKPTAFLRKPFRLHDLRSTIERGLAGAD